MGSYNVARNGMSVIPPNDNGRAVKLLAVTNEEIGEMSPRPEIDKFKVPQDVGYSWFIVFASFLMNILIVGLLLRTIGILFLAITEYYAVPTTSTVWIPGTMTGVGLFGSAFTGILADWVGPRAIVVIGSVIGSSGFVISSFITKIELLYLTLGVMPGISFACSYVPTVAHVAKYFKKRRSLATGMGMAGSGIGAFIAAPLTTFLLEHYSLKGTLLILGGFLFHVAIAGMMLRPTQFYTLRRTVIKDRHISRIIREEKPKKEDCNKVEDINLAEKVQLKKLNVEASRLDDKKCKLAIIRILCNISFIIFLISTVFLFVGYYNTATIVLPAIGKERGLEAQQIALVMSIFGGCDALGRITLSALDDKKMISTSLLLAICMIASAAMCFMVNFLGKTFAELAVICAIFGYLVGSLPPLQTIVVAQIVGLENLQTAFGILFIVGVPQILIQQGAAQLYEITGSWSIPVNICATCFVIGGAFLILLHIYSKRKSKSEKDIKSNENNNTISVIELTHF